MTKGFYLGKQVWSDPWVVAAAWSGCVKKESETRKSLIDWQMAVLAVHLGRSGMLDSYLAVFGLESPRQFSV